MAHPYIVDKLEVSSWKDPSWTDVDSSVSYKKQSLKVEERNTADSFRCVLEGSDAASHLNRDQSDVGYNSGFARTFGRDTSDSLAGCC